MYTILLADDEESVIEVLRTSIGWQELGVGTLLSVMDGMAALEQFEQHKIDLLIADIRMPRMDGMELIRRVKMISPQTRCILLTAYSEFEYAQTAIRLGVENYLLKPIVKNEIEQTIRSALDNIYRKRGSSDNLLRENTLRRWTAGAIGEEELAERASVLGINLYRPVYCVMCIARKGDVSTALFRTACVEMLETRYDIYAYWDDKGRYMMILGGKEMDSEQLEQLVKEAAEKADRTKSVAVSFGVPVNEAESLHISYQTAIDTLEQADMRTEEVILPGRKPGTDFLSDLLAGEVRILYYEQEQERRTNGYRHIAGKLCGKLQRDKEYGGWLVRACIQVLVEEFPQKDGLQELVYREVPTGGWPQEPEKAGREMAAFLERVYRIFEECLDSYSPVVQRTIRYIRDKVLEGELISLKEFCGKIGMNSAYLGHIFKTETGLFFNDYLNRCRVERSIVLMRNPDRKLGEIAELVGFSYASYYIKCFRSCKGVSPSVYRQGLLRTQDAGHLAGREAR